MCRPVTCKKCGKTTWAGCGQHVNQVLAGIPAAQRCAGHASDSGSAASGGRLRRLFGRGERILEMFDLTVARTTVKSNIRS